MEDPLKQIDLGSELYWEPVRIVDPDAWAGHLSIAFWLTKAARPEVFVELGTHSGNSYFAFCQAVAALDLPTACFAVDTWKGDEHAGAYDESVYAEVAAHNANHYGAFSTLMRTTFDEARRYFSDGRIDLLHIDGLHTYDAVRHDFETWRPALSSRAVVVFHDVNVRERDFGVWRLWEELSAEHPSFAFDHSHGLGVLGVGTDQPEPLRHLFSLSKSPEAAAAIRRPFAARGDDFRRRVRLQIAERNAQQAPVAIDALRQELARAAQWHASVAAAQDLLLASRNDVLSTTHALLESREAELKARDAIIIAQERIIAVHAHDLRSERDEKTRLLGELKRARDDAGAAHAAGAEAMASSARDRAAYASLEATFRNSTSWKATAPLRGGAHLARRVARRMLGRSQTVLPGSETMPTGELPPAADPPFSADHKTALRHGLQTRLDAMLATGGRLRMPQSENPDVSILLVLHNQAELTFGCLASIAECQLGKAEVLILDNASSDQTRLLLDQLDGARIIQNQANLHFLLGVNEVARHARGRNLLLLNNDALLLPGSVEAALRTLESDATVGAVGGRIILPDGTLQEAGCIIWNDGTCAGYGRGRNPDDPEFMFQRDVDYCSGAFLLTRRVLFNQLQGFDRDYAPAYYEETDYCVRLWKAGFRVAYEPDAVILHYEFGSSVNAQIALDLQQRNHRRFATIHAAWLESRLPNAPQNILTARAASRGRKRILMLEDRLPKESLGAGYPRSRHLARELVAAGVDLTFYPMFRREERWPDIRSTLGPTVETFRWGSAEQLRSFLESRRGYYDALLVCRPHNMRSLLDAVGPDRDLIGDAKVIYDAEAVFAQRDILQRELDGDPLGPQEAAVLLADEVILTRGADAVISVSEAEQRLFEMHGVGPCFLLGHSITPRPGPAPFEARRNILFVGAIHDENAPNADAVRWFASEIMPPLRQALGDDVRLQVVGINNAASVAALGGSMLDLVGPVEDLAACFNQARICVVPSRLAAGIPRKLHDAAAHGVPIVTTELIATQVGWQDGRDLLVASDAGEFANAVARLYHDQTLWEALRTNALMRCEESCSEDSFRRTLHQVLDLVPLQGRAAHPSAAPASATTAPHYVGRSEHDDISAAVPFGYLPAPSSRPASLAVVCHIYHTEVLEEIQHYLRHIPMRASLFISTDTERKRDLIAARFQQWNGGPVTIRVSPNRGRDIAPKLIGLRDAHETHDLVLHLHSKRSPHNALLAPWRSFLLENLLGSPAIVESVFESFARNPQLGMVFPQHYEYIRHWLDWGANFPTAEALARRMGIVLDPRAALDFPSGSMFWARGAALRPLLDLDLGFDEFPAESGQTEGTLAHAIERLYTIVCERAGFDWMKIAQPALYLKTDTIVPIRNVEGLSRFIAEHGVRLTGSSPPHPRPEAPPVTTFVPPLLRDIQRRRGAGIQDLAAE